MSSAVEQWLSDNGLAAHRRAFVGNHVGMEMLPHLTREDLAELGLNVGERHMFLRAVERLGPLGHHIGASTETVRGSLDFPGERRLVSVLFCDIVESTRLTSLIDPEELGDLLRSFYDSTKAITEGYGGFCGNLIGDGATHVYGYPSHHDDALRAVNAALTMTREVQKLSVPSLPDWQFKVRAAIATGHVVITKSADRDTPQIVGEPPNLAERMKQACPPGSVVIDPATRQLVGTNFELVDLGDIALKGFDEPVALSEVVAPRSGLTRFEGAHSGGVGSRLIGRYGDLALLRSRWDLARNGEGQVVLLTGQAGIGKSRIASALADSIADQGWQHQVYQCSELYRYTALHPVANRIIRDARIRFSDTPKQKFEKLTRHANLRFGSHPEAMSVFASLLSIPVHAGFVPSAISPDDWRSTIFNVIFEEIAFQGKRRPILLVVEDAHWIDPTSLELLDGIVERSLNLPLLVLITSRDDALKARWGLEANVTHLQLNRLSTSLSNELCQEILGDNADLALMNQIVSTAQGIPLFLEEFAKHFQDLRKRPAGSARAANSRVEGSIPNPLFSLLAERLDLLDLAPGAKRIAQIAAAFGHDFSIALLTQMPSLQGIGNMDTAVGQILASGLFVKHESDVPTLGFRHSIFREILYATLLKPTRRELHGEIGQVLIDTGLAASEPSIAAHHLSEAQRTEEAIAYWTAAGLQSNQKSATAEAFSHFSKALELIRQLPESTAVYELELPLRLGFGGAASAIEGYSADDIEQNYSRMLFLADALDRPRERFRAHLGLAAFYEVAGEIEKCQFHCDECLRLAELSGDRFELLHAHRISGELSFYRGRFRTSCRHLETALSLYDATDHLGLIGELGDDPGVLSRMYYALSLWFLGLSDQAAENCSIGLDLATELAHAFTGAQADFYASWLYTFAQDWQLARKHAERAIERATAHEYSLVLGLSRVIRGWTMARSGEGANAEQDMLDGMALIRAPHADVCQSSFLAFLADYYRISGDIDKGLETIREAEAVATERFASAERQRIHGELLAGRDSASAEALLRDALATAREQESLAMELRTALSLHRLLTAEDRASGSLDVLAAIYGRLTEGLDSADAKECGALIAAKQPAYRHG